MCDLKKKSTFEIRKIKIIMIYNIVYNFQWNEKLSWAKRCPIDASSLDVRYKILRYKDMKIKRYWDKQSADKTQ